MLLHPLRELFGLLPQLVLFAGQALELPLQLGFFELVAIPREIALLPVERILAPGELANPLEQIVLLVVVLPLFGRVGRLVIRGLALAQLLIEQRRQVGLRAIRSAAASGLLRPRHLAAARVGNRLEQVVERFHLVRQRRRRADLVQLADRAPHRLDRAAERIFARRRTRQTTATAGVAARARGLCARLFGPRR